MAILVEPSLAYEASFRTALAELSERNENGFHWPGVRDLDPGFDAYTRGLLRQKNPLYVRPGNVPQSVFWMVENQDFLGVVKLRHALTDSLRLHGGHIGYGIRPSRRGKGYGSLILRLVLREAAKIGLRRVLVTCNSHNAASRRVIEGNGGALEDEITVDDDGKPLSILRFWIELNADL